MKYISVKQAAELWNLVRTQRPELLRAGAHRGRVPDRKDMDYPRECDQAHARRDGKKSALHPR